MSRSNCIKFWVWLSQVRNNKMTLKTVGCQKNPFCYGDFEHFFSAYTPSSLIFGTKPKWIDEVEVARGLGAKTRLVRAQNLQYFIRKYSKLTLWRSVFCMCYESCYNLFTLSEALYNLQRFIFWTNQYVEGKRNGSIFIKNVQDSNHLLSVDI